MATQTLEFSAASGLTISCKLFAIGSDTVVDTQTATEKTNDVNRYSVDFVDVAAGTYRLNGFVGSDGGFANEVFDLTLTTATFQPRSESAGLDAAGVRSAVGLASANLDTQFASIGTDFLGTVLTKGSAGTIERAFWQTLKIAALTDGEVAGTPTATAFDTNLTNTSGAFDHLLLVFVSGALEGEARPIKSYVSTNGRIVLQEALTAAPSVADEFVIVPDHSEAVTVDTAAIAAAVVTELGGTAVEISSIVASDGTTITIVRGDDYSLADSRHITWTGTSSNQWPDLTGATVKFTAKSNAGTLASTLTVIQPTGTQSLRMELTSTETDIASGRYTYDVQATLSSGRVATLVFGELIVKKSYTEPQ